MNDKRRKIRKVEINRDRMERWFINFDPEKETGRSLGPFTTLDKTLRYVYYELDRPNQKIEVIEVNDDAAAITFIPDFDLNIPKKKEKQKSNVIPINRGEE
jgi:hypothetical protein|tara:strand:+ start:404 stop:706 length:303 start_codon:yes stop_codon:yes gene_type:complete